MKTLPVDVQPYKRTPEFDESTVPSALLRRHDTKACVWARIHVLEGRMRYRILEPETEEHELAPGHDGIIEPRVDHQVEILGPVRFCVEFLR